MKRLSIFKKSPKITLGTADHSLPLLPFNVILPKQYISAHKHVIGVSKMGKSRTLEAMFLQLMDQGIGVSFIDPHGDSSVNILAMLIKNGFFEDKDNFKRFLYVEFLEDDYFLPFNILKVHRDEEGQPRLRPSTLADIVRDAFHRCWPNLDLGNAPRFDDIIGKGCQVLISNHLPISCMSRLLENKEYRDQLLENVTDFDVLSFFRNRVDKWETTKEGVMMMESTLTRISLMTDSDVLKYSLGQTDNVLDFRSIMDQGVCVIYNLSLIQNETAQKFLGCLLTRGYEAGARSRAGTLTHQRRPHHLIFDEFHKFSAQSEEALSTALSELRKYEYYSTMAHQTFSQASWKLRGALQNAEVRIVFRVGHDDAEYLAPIIGDTDPTKVKEEVSETLVGTESDKKGLKAFLELKAQWEDWTKTLENLPKRHAYVKILGRRGAVKMKNLTLPSTEDVSQSEIDRIRREYRLRLMTAKDKLLLPHQANLAKSVNLSRVAYIHD